MGKTLLSLGLLALFGFLTVVPFPGTASASEVIIRSDTQFDFAREYLERGEYGKAAAEFERFRFFFPEDPRADRALYLIGFCLLREGRYEESREVWGRLISPGKEEALSAKALFMVGEAYYEEGQREAARAVFSEVVTRYPEGEMKNAALFRLGWCDLRADQWEEASRAFGRVESGSPFSANARKLAEESPKGAGLPYKDPTTAGVLAGLLPGAGHVYVGRYKDGTVAFLLNAVFIWAAIEAFDSDQDVLGGILTFLEVGWYSGNIYSAVNAAHKHNRSLKEGFLERLDERLDLRLFTGAGREAGLALLWRF